MSTTAIAPRRAAVLGDLASTSLAGSAALVTGGAALIGLLAQVVVKLPFTPVPVTGQTLGVLLVAAALGRRRGMASTGLYGLAGVAGVPWFAGGVGGWSAVSFGYVIGFVAAAAVVGGLAERGWDRRPLRTLAAMAVADAAILTCGTVWLAGVLDLGGRRAVELGVLPFLAGDAVKIGIAAALLPGAWWLAGRVTRRG